MTNERPRELGKTKRQQLVDDLYGLGLDLKKDRLSAENKEKLSQMLLTNARNLEFVDQDTFGSIGTETLDTVLECLIDAFYQYQDAIEILKKDIFKNEWRCGFSNRVMHKSMKVRNLERGMIKNQEHTYKSIGMLTSKPFAYIVEQDFIIGKKLKLEDFNFFIPGEDR